MLCLLTAIQLNSQLCLATGKIKNAKADGCWQIYALQSGGRVRGAIRGVPGQLTAA
jgi:hypothetical protein